MNAGSCFIVGYTVVLDRHSSEASSVEEILSQGYSQKNEWPRRIMITDESPFSNTLKLASKKLGIVIENVSLESVEAIVGEARDFFMEKVAGVI